MGVDDDFSASSKVADRRVLVTGGSGFIGRHVLARLEELGYEAHSVDLRPCPISISGKSAVINILDRRQLSEFLRAISPHYVIHLAAYASIRGNNDLIYRTNLEGTQNLINALPKGVKRIGFASTQLVVRMGDEPGDGTYFNPYTYYGQTKAEMETSIRETCGLDWVIFRPTTIWGPYHPSFLGGLYKYVRRGLYLHPDSGRPIIRSYGFVENAADQMISILSCDAASHRVLYISDPPIDSGVFLDRLSLALRDTPVRRVPTSLLKTLGFVGDAFRAVRAPFPLDSGRVLRMTSNYVVPVGDTLRLTGDPKVSLEEGVRKTVEWIYENDSPRNRVV